jgi:transposase
MLLLLLQPLLHTNMAPTTRKQSQFRTPSPQPIERGEHDTPARARVLQLREEGHTAVQIREKTGIPERTQRRFASTGPRRPGQYRPGRPHKLSGDILDRIIKDLAGRYKIRKLDYESHIKRNNLNVCVNTLRNALRERGIRKYRAAHKRWLQKSDCKRRLAFAKEMIHWPVWRWKDVRFSDESHFHHNSRTAEWVLRRRGERFQPDTIQKKFKIGASEFHVWGCVGWNFKSELVFYGIGEDEPRNVTMDLYIKKMLPILKGYRDEAEAKGKGFIFQEDNDGGYGTRSQENSARLYKDQINLDFIDDWPAFSPDLSPIENVWRILKQRVRQHEPRTKEELKRAIEVEWEALTQQEINRVVWGTEKGRKWTMRDRLQAVIDNEGRMTKY